MEDDGNGLFGYIRLNGKISATRARLRKSKRIIVSITDEIRRNKRSHRHGLDDVMSPAGINGRVKS